MKKNKLYTANKWNQPAFMRKENIFKDGSLLGGLNPQQMAQLKAFNMSSTPGTLITGNNAAFMQNAHNALSKSIGLGVPDLSNNTLSALPTDAGAVTGNGGIGGFLGGIGDKLGGVMGGGKLAGTPMGGIVSGLGSAVGSIGGGLIGGGLQSGAGSAISNIGGAVGSAVGTVNPVLGAVVSAGSGIIGGLTNRMFGSSLNEEKIAEIEAAQQKRQEENNALYSAKDTNSLTELAGNLSTANNFTAGDVGEDGWFASDAEEKYNQLKAEEERVSKLQELALANATDNVNENNFLTSARNSIYSFGGSLNGNKKGNRMNRMTQMPIFMNSFALGGDVQMHGADFTTDLSHIDAGDSHEENPYDGVQMGVDREGTPNLVEEGETIYNDYVFSDRILADEATKKMFHLPKKKDITFAEISKRLEKEISERPNDPISKAGFKAQMQTLEDQQERQKSAMEAERARAAFEALSPEEQQAVMQQVAKQDAMAQQAAMQQPSPEEIAMAQQQQAMADGSQAALGQEPQMNCFGGRINRFDNGGQAYTKMLNSLGFHTQKEFDDWAKENSIDFGDIWKDNPNILSIDILGKLWSNEKFKEALKKKNPALAHAFETKGYDFGTYVPTSNSRATIQSISKGNWKATNGQGWFGSDDLAFKQATEGMSEDEIKALTTEQLAERMAKTDAYKNTSKWLENSDNALMYLNTLLNDPDTPDVAKKHALQYVKDGKWKDGYKYNYNDVFGKVRSTNPGTYWHTAMEANRGNEANNFVINEDGSIEPILGNVPTDWTSAGNYSWADENSDYIYNYYKRPAVAAKPEAAKTPEEKKAEEEKGVAPKHRAEWLRYAGLFGPAVGLGLQMAGVGRPDTAQLDAAIASAGDVNTADWKPLGNYLTYRPLDIWFEQNRLNANARATDRAIMNNASPIGTKMAGLLASGYNDQIASGNLFRQAQEYNDNLRKQVAEFNRGTDQFNSEQYGATSRFNADAYNNARRANAQLRLQAAAQKMDADAGWYNSLYGNIAGLFKGIGDIGTENFRMNRIGEMAARGDFGTATDETYGFEPYLTRSNRKSKKNR